jgi:hypothetical protein
LLQYVDSCGVGPAFDGVDALLWPHIVGVLQDSGPYCDWLAVGGGGALCWHWLLLLLLQHQAQRKEKGNLTKHF